jgi:hypothetical protein
MSFPAALKEIFWLLFCGAPAIASLIFLIMLGKGDHDA